MTIQMNLAGFLFEYAVLPLISNIQSWLSSNLCLVFLCSRLYNEEVEKSANLNQSLGVGIALFQGLSNVALNGKFEQG